MTAAALPAGRAVRRQFTYRVTTALVIGECIGGGIFDLARKAPFYPVMVHLGYPPYFADILGVAKILAAATLLAPALPRLKEWAYAGIVFNMVGAAASHIAAGDGITAIAPPVAFALITLLSWHLRQPSALRPTPHSTLR
jgi:hypothetical protein